MVWKINPSTAKTADLRKVNPGDVFLLLNGTVPHSLAVRVASGGKEIPVMVWDQPDRPALKLVVPRGELPTLTVCSAADIRLEIDDCQASIETSGKVGELVLSDAGAFVVAEHNKAGMLEEVYVSLEKWTALGVGDIGSLRRAFLRWRLVQQVSPTESRLLLSQGDWPKSPDLVSRETAPR